jgi:succinyl-CoA synthetase beta subunit
MKLLEYEAKQLLRKSHLPVPTSKLIASIADTDTITAPIVLKSQVPTGGRGKLGGVVIVEDANELSQTVKQLFALDIKGFIPNTLLAEEKIAIQNEHYLSLLIDRDTGTIRLVAHKDGGVEVENNQTDDFLNIPIDSDVIDSCAVELATYFGYDITLIGPFLKKLYTTFVDNDATLLEINPLIYTKTNELTCSDCKMELDDSASFRHPDWQFENTAPSANFVTLNQSGTIATIANGAGLAMATVDAVAAADMTPANFLDIGGGANTASVLAAFQKIVSFPHISAIVINIFAGITRCDEVARAIIAAKQQMTDLPPLYIRLAGTNFEEAVALLSAENIPTLATLEECILNAKEHTNA